MELKQLLKQAYERYGAQLLAVCRRYSPDIETAEDLFQDGFISAFKAAHSFKGHSEAELYAWLRTIMVNTCLMRIRKKDLLKESIDIDKLHDSTMDMAHDGIEADVGMVDEDSLLRMVSSLPEGERAVFNLFVFEEMSHRDIALKLGISERASISKMYRAKKMLAAMIKEHGN